MQESCSLNVYETDNCDQFHQNVYAQLLHVQIPKVQKDSKVKSVCSALLGSAHTKAARKMGMKLTPGR